MTARIGHSIGGMRRLVQMRTTRVTIYVEGRDLDPDFYGRLCRTICIQRGLTYEVIPADRISGGGGSGGKMVLLTLFKYLRRKNALVDRSSNVSKLAMFYLDKDTDDIFRKRLRSDHLIYTSRFCVENHLFCDGNLLQGIATGGSVDLGLISSRIANPEQWRKNAAIRWREWIVLCLTAQKLRLGAAASYSALHDTIDSKVNQANLAACRSDLQTRSKKPQTEFDRIVAWASSKTDRAISSGLHDQVFKGKWYVVFAMYELDQLSVSHAPINLIGARDRLIGCLMATLQYEAEWADHYRDPLKKVTAAL